MKYSVSMTTSFAKECRKSGLYSNDRYHPKIENAIRCWKDGVDLPDGYRDHSLHKDKYNKDEYNRTIDGVRGDLREFHVNGNYVVVYKKYGNKVMLIELLHAGKHKDILHSSQDL